MAKPKTINFHDNELSNAYYTHDLLGSSEYQQFQEYIQLEINLFNKLLGLDKNFFELIQNITSGADLSKDINLQLFKELRMSDDLREIINEITQKAINDPNIRRVNDTKKKLKDKLITSNLRLSVILAHKYKKYCMNLSFGDLVQEGIFGIMKAIDRFDPDMGYKFSTYASWWIRHRMQRSISDYESLIRYPAHVHDTMLIIKKIESKCAAQYGVATDEKIFEIIKNSGMKQISVKNAMESKNNKLLYLDATTKEGDLSIHDLIPDDSPNPFDLFEEKKNCERVNALLDTISPMESAVLKFRFGINTKDDLTLQEIANKYHLSRERIRQIERDALNKIRRRVGAPVKMRSVA